MGPCIICNRFNRSSAKSPFATGILKRIASDEQEFQSLKREKSFCNITAHSSSPVRSQGFNRSSAKSPFATPYLI